MAKEHPDFRRLLNGMKRWRQMADVNCDTQSCVS
jgi:hypothetical protein